MLRRIPHILIAWTLLLAASYAAALTRDARATQARLRRLKACVLLIPNMGELNGAPADPSQRWTGAIADPDAISPTRSPDPNPYLFYVLNERKDMKPDGWQFYNPAAPATATLAQSNRWALVTGNAAALPEGTRLSADMAAYWETVLSPSNLDRLEQMDVIYIPIARNSGGMNPTAAATYFNEDQRRILARLADSGVTIWVDWALNGTASGPTADNVLGGTGVFRNPFFTNLDFKAAGGTAFTPPIKHPLLRDPFVIDDTDAQILGSQYDPMQPPSTARAINVNPAGMQPTANFGIVVPTTNGDAYIAATQYGAGHVVATAGDVGNAVSKVVPAAQVKAGTPDLGGAEPEDLKFAYNVFQWGTEVTAQQKNGRHTGQSSAQLAGLIEQGNYPSLLPPGAAGAPWTRYPPAGLPVGTLPANPCSPIYVNGAIVAAPRYKLSAAGAIQGPLIAIDPSGAGNYEESVDATGSADDGNEDGSTTTYVNPATPATNSEVDISIGLPLDEITHIPSSTVNGLIMGLCAGEVPNTNGYKASQYIFGAGSSGLFSVPAPGRGGAAYWSPANLQVATYNKISYTGAPGFTTVPDPSGTFTGVQSLLIGGGVAKAQAFGSSNNGKLACFGVPANGAITNPLWYYPPDQESNRMGKVSGPVVTAQVYDVGSGATDTMAFATSLSSGDVSGGQAGGGAGDTTGRVDGFIVATRGDTLSFPRGANAPGGNNPAAGRTFVCARWLDPQPGVGQVPQTAELIWDPNAYYEVRIVDRTSGYVLLKYNNTTNTDPQFQLLRNGTAGQIQLPAPPNAVYAVPGQPQVWDLSRFVLLADYSPLPVPVDVNGATIRPRFTPATPYVRGATQNNILPTGIAGGVAVGKDNLVYYATGIGYMCAAEWRKGHPQFRWKMRAIEYNGTGGQSTIIDPDDPTYLQDYAFTASPAAGDRIVFASRGVARGTVYVIEPDATIRFRLQSGPLTAAQASEVMIEADHGLGVPQNSPFLLSSQQPWGRVPGQFSVDPDTATVTFNNMENFSLDLAQALAPSQVPVDTGGKPAVLIHWRFRSEAPNITHDAYVPLPVVSIYQDNTTNERWVSGPTIAGDRVFLMGENGNLHEIPLNPRGLAPNFPSSGGTFQTAFNLDTYGLRKYRDVGATLGSGVTSAPAVADGLVAVESRRGLTLYNSPSVVIADSNRVIEASGDSTALASASSVLKQRMDVSEFPIPTDPSFANTVINGTPRPILTENKLLNRPTKVLKLNRGSSLSAFFASTMDTGLPPDDPSGLKEHREYAEDSFLAADTGNDRIVEFNPAGKVIGEWTHFQDPLALLPSGESLKLSGPMDVQRWIDIENPGGMLGRLYVVHTLIADTGNSRIVELVDKIRYQNGYYGPDSFPVVPGQVGADNATPIRWYHVLVWSSQTNAQGLKLRYRTAQRVFWPDGNGAAIPVPGGLIPPDATSTKLAAYLPAERFLSTTMATVSGQQVQYPSSVPVTYNGFFRDFTTATPLNSDKLAVLERKPRALGGGDSIVFLRGRYYGAGGAVQAAGLREAKLDSNGNPIAASDGYRLGMGVIDPNIAPITDVWDETIGNNPAGGPGADQKIHTLSGIQSIQRTIRADVKFTPWLAQGAATVRGMFGMYLLIADADGVWEVRLLPMPQANIANQPAPSSPWARLAWAFTNEDYAYVTGAGNGDATKIYSTAGTDNAPGGRRLNAFSARRLPNGLVLIASRTPPNEQPPPSVAASGEFRQRFAGGDVMLIQPMDYMTAAERAVAGVKVPYDRVNLVTAGNAPLHGWRPEQWVQAAFGGAISPALNNQPSSIRWRASDQLDIRKQPFKVGQTNGIGQSPYQLTGSYVPVQPSYADVVY